MRRYRLILSTLFLSSYTLALPLKKAPYYFVSDALTYNSKSHTLTYTGHVKIDHGTTHLTGDKVILYTTTKNKLKEILAFGHPATYNGISQKDKRKVSANARKLIDMNIAQMIYLDGHAHLLRNRNTISAAHIIYDKNKDIAHTRGDHTQRQTHIVVMPQNR